ncbi:MAG: hypothetical protein O2799_04715 [Planctomycetota bacterium]|nr:hypothetical protein [Planctomycetota bacterium]
MADLSPQLIDLGHETLFRLAREDARIEAEFAESATEFFGAETRVATDPVGALLEARRHQEWFLFERPCRALGGVPSEKLLGAWREGLAEAPDPEELEVALLESQAGVFAVRQVGESGEAWIEDLGNLAEHVLAANPEAPPLAPGDLLVGRLHPSRAGSVVASPAAGVFRAPELLAAVEADLASRREQGGSARLRFDQAALEKAFYSQGSPAQEPSEAAGEDPAATLEAARAFLAEARLEPAQIEDLLAQLRKAPLDPTRWTLGTEDGLGEILDQLAFETDLDLTRARAVLGAAWHALRVEVDDRRKAPKDVRSALADFDKGRAEGRDVQALLDDLERDLGLEDEPDSEEDSGPPALGGVVEALVAEFRWEQESVPAERRARPEALAALDHLCAFGEAFEQPEELDGEALRRLLCFWAPERRLPASTVEALLEALEAFCPWADAEQDLDLASTWKDLQGLRTDLVRVLALNEGQPQALDAQGALFEVLEAEDPRGLPGLLVSEADGIPQRVETEPRAFQGARAGDLLRGALSGSTLRVYTAYPGAARAR